MVVAIRYILLNRKVFIYFSEKRSCSKVIALEAIKLKLALTRSAERKRKKTKKQRR